MYNKLKESLTAAKAAKDKLAVADLICVIDAVDKKVFAEKKKSVEEFIIDDSVVLAVIKNQLKNITLSYEKALGLTGASPATDSMQDTITILKFHLPPAVTEDDLRYIISSLGASNMGQAMGMLKKHSAEIGYDYDGKEASILAKEMFV